MERQAFTALELAQRWGVSRQTIYDQVAAKEIASIKIGRAIRIPREEVDRIEGRCASSSTEASTASTGKTPPALAVVVPFEPPTEKRPRDERPTIDLSPAALAALDWRRWAT